MLVVLDTNVVLRAISSQSKLAVIIDKLFSNEFDLLISSDILLEYEEIITRFYSVLVAKSFLDFLLLLPNVIKISPSYKLNLIPLDPDDNKFIDCAFAGNATYIVTDDKHFNILKRTMHPQISILTALEFKTILK
jgi:uncharacterized protein